MVSTPPYSNRTWSSRSCVEQFGIYKEEDQLTGFSYYKNSTRYIKTFVVAAVLGVITLLVCLMVNDIAKTSTTKRDREGMHILLATPRPPGRRPTNMTNLTSVPDDDYPTTTTTTTTIATTVLHTTNDNIESASKILHGDSPRQSHTDEENEEGAAEEDSNGEVIERIGENGEEEENSSVEDERGEEEDERGGEEDKRGGEEQAGEENEDGADEDYDEEEEEDDEEEDQDNDEGSTEHEEVEEEEDQYESAERIEALPFTVEKTDTVSEEIVIDQPMAVEEKENASDQAFPKSEAIFYRQQQRGYNSSYPTHLVKTRQFVSDPRFANRVPQIHIHVPHNRDGVKSSTYSSGHHHSGQTYGPRGEADNRRSGKFDANIKPRRRPGAAGVGGRPIKKKKKKRPFVKNELHLQPPLRRHSVIEEYQTPILIDYDTYKGLHINHNLVTSNGGGDGIRRFSVGDEGDLVVPPPRVDSYQNHSPMQRKSDTSPAGVVDDGMEHRQMEFPIDQPPTFHQRNDRQITTHNLNHGAATQSSPTPNTGIAKGAPVHVELSMTSGAGDTRRAEEKNEHAATLTPLDDKIEDAAFDTYSKYWSPYLEDLKTDAMVSEATEARIMNHRHPKRNNLTPKPFVPKGIANNNNHNIKNNDIQSSSTKKYPQLSSYHYPKDAKNIRDIIKYLTNIDDSKKKEPEKMRKPLGTIMKLKGVYLDHGEDIYKYSENKDDSSVKENTKPKEYGFVYKDDEHYTSLNGHAYIADPFYQFKPDNMADINSMVSPDFRFPTPTNEALFKHTLNHLNEKKRMGHVGGASNSKYFPKPPINFNTRPASSSSAGKKYANQVPGKYTTAIYRPLGASVYSGNDKYEMGVKGPILPASQFDKNNVHYARRAKTKPKPLSVMLDIYPLLEPSAPEPSRPLPNRVRFNPIKFGVSPKPQRLPPMNNFVSRRPPFHAFRKGLNRMAHGRDGDATKKEKYKTQMVVHLNLHPKKKNRNSGYDRSGETDDQPAPRMENRRTINISPNRRHYNEDYEGEIKRPNEEDYYQDEGVEEGYGGEGYGESGVGVEEEDEVEEEGTGDVTAGGEGETEDEEVEEAEGEQNKGETKEEVIDNHGSSTDLYRGVVTENLVHHHHHHDDEEDDDDDDDVMKGRELTLVLNADIIRPNDRHVFLLRNGKAVPLVGEKRNSSNESEVAATSLTNGEPSSVNVTTDEGGTFQRRGEGIDVNSTARGDASQQLDDQFQVVEDSGMTARPGDEEMVAKEVYVQPAVVDFSDVHIYLNETYTEDGVTKTSADEGVFNADKDVRLTPSEMSPEGSGNAENKINSPTENQVKVVGLTVLEIPSHDLNNTLTLGQGNATIQVKKNPLLILLKSEMDNRQDSIKDGPISQTGSNFTQTDELYLDTNNNNDSVIDGTEGKIVDPIMKYTAGSLNLDNYPDFSRHDDTSLTKGKDVLESMYNDVLKYAHSDKVPSSNESITVENDTKYTELYSSDMKDVIHI